MPKCLGKLIRSLSVLVLFNIFQTFLFEFQSLKMFVYIFWHMCVSEEKVFMENYFAKIVFPHKY